MSNVPPIAVTRVAMLIQDDIEREWREFRALIAESKPQPWYRRWLSRLFR